MACHWRIGKPLTSHLESFYALDFVAVVKVRSLEPFLSFLATEECRAFNHADLLTAVLDGGDGLKKNGVVHGDVCVELSPR